MSQNNDIDLKHVEEVKQLVELLKQELREKLEPALQEYRFHVNAPTSTKNINSILIKIIRYIKKDIKQLKEEIPKNNLLLYYELIPYRSLLSHTIRNISKICESDVVKPTEKAHLQICVDKLEQLGELFNVAMPPLQSKRKKKKSTRR